MHHICKTDNGFREIRRKTDYARQRTFKVVQLNLT